MQSKFKNVNAYKEWRTHWRRAMADLVCNIITCKNEMREVANGSWRYCQAQSYLRTLKMQARALMVAREAVERDYRERQRINYPQEGVKNVG